MKHSHRVQFSLVPSREEIRPGLLRSLALMAVTLALVLPKASSAATYATQCTALDICYCVNTDYRDAINDNVARVRQLIATNKAQGKAIGYLSVPLSPAGGGSFAVNAEVAAKTANRVTARLGARSAWLLNPGAEAGSGMNGASGADFMYMWTQILEGRGGLGEDFDFFYFAGPTDFAAYFGLTGQGDLDRLEDWFDQRVAQDPDFKKSVDQGGVTKPGFRNYYGLRASVAFSYGSHDEWNIARLINDRRRGATDFGIANQLAILFDGRPVTPGGYENPAASGDVGRCIK
jgi:hypothetical protein